MTESNSTPALEASKQDSTEGVPYMGTIYVGAFPAQTFHHRCLIRAVDDSDAAAAIGKRIEEWVQQARENGDVVFHDGDAWSLDSGNVRLFNSGVKRISEETYSELYYLFSGQGEQATMMVTDAAYAQGRKPAPVPPKSAAPAAHAVLHDWELVESAATAGMTPTARAAAAVDDAASEDDAIALAGRLQPYSVEVAGIEPNSSRLLIDVRPAAAPAPGQSEMALSIAVEIEQGVPCVRIYRADDAAPALLMFARPDGVLAVQPDDGWQYVEMVDRQWKHAAPDIPELGAADIVGDDEDEGEHEAPRQRC